MSQTPRKFSEKIAILERKSRAEVDEFTQVMQDVKKITTGRSPQTTPSSTPYPCSPTGGPGSSSTIQTPSATESPIGLMPDGYNLGAGGYVMHPLSGTPYQRSGGSLPNVHQMVQQKPGQIPQMVMNPNEQWMYWQAAQTSAGGPNQSHSQNHTRTRSPGSAAHYHPYRNSSGNVSAQATHSGSRNERISPLESHMHLQPPDPSWSNSRARSDPAIHMNTVQQALYYTPNNPNGAQFLLTHQQQTQFNTQQAQFQQQQWAQIQNGMSQTPAFYGATTNGGGTMSNGGNGQVATQVSQSNNVSQGSAHQTPNHSQPGSTASSASSVPVCMSSSPQHQQSQVQTPAQTQPPQYNGAYLKQSPCGSPDMAVGSLPNMHSPLIQQQQYKTEQNPPQSYYDYDYDPNQQQPLQSAPATMQQYCNGGSIYAYNQNQIPQSQQQNINPQYIRPQHQLTMPQGVGIDSSQSAPTSPAQSFTNNPLQPQWTSSRHYSASPDNQGIPRVTLTRVEGNTECFQEEFQDLCLDSDIQHALIHGAEDHFDPATESQLINSTR